MDRDFCENAASEEFAEAPDSQINMLSDLQLAMVGGGSADPILA